MKIVTVNVPESYIEAIEKLTGENGLYPSRSELIRCAVREFLIKQFRIIKNITKPKKQEIKIPEIDEKTHVRVPDPKNGGSKIYKIVRRLY